MNLFAKEPLPDSDSEFFETLLQHSCVTVKRIISNSLTTPQSFVQDVDEWVVVLEGCAYLEMQGKVYVLKAGDTLFIPSGVEHTLQRSEDVVIWLALYMKAT